MYLNNLLSKNRPMIRRIGFTVCFTAFAVLTGCGVRFDMQDQPRYKAYKKSEFFADNRASRDAPEGTIARGQLHDNKAFYTGLQICASVWACPVCAAKISERRRAELVAALAVARSMGMQVYLLTLTVPHGLGDDLKALLEQIHKAYSKTSSGRAGQNIRKLLGLRGTVRALETTYGVNGFHPHLHILLFLDGGFSAQYPD